jgi:hypothetical protein
LFIVNIPRLKPHSISVSESPYPFTNEDVEISVLGKVLVFLA